jgi:hypothetical protein
MRFFVFSSCLWLIGMANAQVLTFPEWVHTQNGTLAVETMSLVRDGSGNLVTGGQFEGLMDADPGVNELWITSSGEFDGLVTKMNANGELVWIAQFEGPGEVYIYDVAVDAAGNVYATGIFTQTVDANPGVGEFLLTAQEGSDVFFLKLNAQGEFQWAQSLLGSANNSAYAITIDPLGNVLLTGSFLSTMDFDPTAGEFNLTSSGTGDVFLAKYSSVNGNLIWARKMGGSGDDAGYDLTTDASGNCYVTGFFSSTADFDPEMGVTNLSSTGGYDAFVVKLSSSGSLIWAKQIGGAQQDFGYSLAVNEANEVFVTGIFEGTADMNPGLGTVNLTSLGGYDSFVLKLDNSGNFSWVKQLSGALDVLAYQLTLNSSGLYLVGNFKGVADFNPGQESTSTPSVGDLDGFVLRLDLAGNFIWVHQFGGEWQENTSGVVVNPDGDVFVAGHFSETASFYVEDNSFDRTSAGLTDAFLMKLRECVQPDVPVLNTTSVTICPGDGLTLEISSGNLNDAEEWNWYEESCGSGVIQTGTTLTINPDQNTSYFVRGVGGCTVPGSCVEIAVMVGDNQAPTPAILNLPVLQAACEIEVTTVPTADDNCSGTLNGFTNDPLVYSEQGTFVITWVYEDEAGNQTTQEQSVIISDEEAPQVQNCSENILRCQAEEVIFDEPIGVDNCGSVSVVQTQGQPSGSFFSSSELIVFELTDENGNTSTCSFEIQVISEINTNVIVNSTALSAQQSGASYQWLDCNDDFTEIDGMTGQVFNPKENGEYAVVVSYGECADTSDCIAITTIGFSEKLSETVQLYPNPTQDNVFISGIPNDAHVILLSTEGREIQVTKTNGVDVIELEVKNLPNGVYFIQIVQSDEQATFRFVKQ